MNVLIICSAGMSSSLLVSKLRTIAKERNYEDYKFGFCSMNQVNKYLEKADIILLAPQLDFLYDEFKVKYPSKTVKKIPLTLYGMKDEQDFNDIFELAITRETTLKNQNTQNIVRAKIKRVIYKFSSNSMIKSINNGMLSVLPISFIGSIFTLIISLLDTINMNNSTIFFVREIIEIGINGTTDLVSIYTASLITYSLAKQKDVEPTNAVVNTLISYFILIGRTGEGNIINTLYLGVEGLFSAIIVSVISTLIFIRAKNFSQKTKNKIGNTQSILIFESLSSVIPIFISILFFTGVASFFYFSSYEIFPEWIYSIIYKTISDITSNNIFSDMAITLLSNVLWWIGIHGGQVVNTITNPIYTAFSFENIVAYGLGEPLPNIINRQFRFMYTFGGAGSTLGLVVLMAFFARSERLKNVGKISLPLSFFFINETVIFGVPIVLNLLMFVPFLFITPFLSFLTYLSMEHQLIPYSIGFDLPWTTPFIISGLIQGGVKLAIWQIFMLFLSVILYYPFFKVQDKMYLSQELEESKKLPKSRQESATIRMTSDV